MKICVYHVDENQFGQSMTLKQCLIQLLSVVSYNWSPQTPGRLTIIDVYGHALEGELSLLAHCQQLQVTVTHPLVQVHLPDGSVVTGEEGTCS